MTDWKERAPVGLEQAIVMFKQNLPGWWYSVCECQVSCDATAAPTSESPDIAITYTLPAGSPFDSGFTVDLRQPSTLAEALLDVMNQALAAKAAYAADASQSPGMNKNTTGSAA